MIKNLGFACICQTLDKQGSFKTVQLTSALKLSEQDRYNKIHQLTRQNFDTVYDIMKFNIENGIKLFRISSDMCPLNTHEICNYDFTQDPTILSLASKIKQMAIDNKDPMINSLIEKYNKDKLIDQEIIDKYYIDGTAGRKAQIIK